MVRDWGEDTAVVYDPGTVSTHLITAGAAQILRQCLASGCLTASAAAEMAPDALTALIAAGLLQDAR